MFKLLILLLGIGVLLTVINALRHAGFDLRTIPATPERIMAAAPSHHKGHQRHKGAQRGNLFWYILCVPCVLLVNRRSE